MYHLLLHRTPIPIIPESRPPHKSSLSRVGMNQLNCVQMDGGGVDSDGRQFKSAEEMWREAVGDGDPLKKSQWYSQGVGYWQGVEATVDGVLGGYGHVNKPDIEGSEAFLNLILAERFPDAGSGRRLNTLDCGSGIGRVTKNLLIRYFNEVDLLEPVSHFLDTARENLSPENLMVTEDHKAVNFFCVPLQGGLRPGGLFILKENIARNGFVLDNQDKSITRSDLYFKQLFKQCGLHILKMKDQKGFPNELFAVKMYALTTDLPKKTKTSKSKRQVNRPGIIR
ncbi:alpha N-terminal protein methyltransferase 1-like isoform X2 [Salvia miltiorrhiza]|uniref:alpha N-terminal protein methyltransferase 1-like isoform X2 n=1 Tax=Salvia miltiorrhiza TaxID=226208 RepID=UPI0025AD2B46|nr:alpha N-terminal protein methyltransferase 1-like isoform X2 [Salvia miltiorrhiza]